jgi:hypothetical protein
VDSAGHEQGNCHSVDGTGAQWCYIDTAYGSSCQDLTPSARFPSNPWSYEACATPNIGSYECPAISSVVVAAPSNNYVDHGHGTPSHVHVPVVVAPAPSHVHVSAPLVAAYDPVHTHFSRDQIPQGPYSAPIPKRADTAFPTK